MLGEAPPALPDAGEYIGEALDEYIGDAPPPPPGVHAGDAPPTAGDHIGLAPPCCGDHCDGEVMPSERKGLSSFVGETKGVACGETKV